MCEGIVGFSIIVGEMIFFIGGKRFGRMEGVVNFVEEGLGIVRELTLVCEGLLV